MAIKKRSRVPGVMITQFVEVVPAGKTTPDFTRKPVPVTIQEGKKKKLITKTRSFPNELLLVVLLTFVVLLGKKAFFKTLVTGVPQPTVTWGRNKGEIDDQEKYKIRFDERSKEYILEVRT